MFPPGAPSPYIPRDTPQHSQHLMQARGSAFILFPYSHSHFPPPLPLPSHPLSLPFPGFLLCPGLLPWHFDFAAHTHLEEGIKLALVAHKMGQVANEAVPLLIGCFIVCVIWIDT